MGIILAIVITAVVSVLACYGYLNYTGSTINLVKPKVTPAPKV